MTNQKLNQFQKIQQPNNNFVVRYSQYLIDDLLLFYNRILGTPQDNHPQISTTVKFKIINYVFLKYVIQKHQLKQITTPLPKHHMTKESLNLIHQIQKIDKDLTIIKYIKNKNSIFYVNQICKEWNKMNLNGSIVGIIVGTMFISCTHYSFIKKGIVLIGCMQIFSYIAKYRFLNMAFDMLYPIYLRDKQLFLSQNEIKKR